MIKLMRVPDSVAKLPEWVMGMEWKDHVKQEEEYTSKVAAWAKAVGKSPYAGEVVKFPVADGYAEYVVFDKDKLIHLAIGDAWEFDYVTRLTAKDIAENVSRHQALRRLFGGK